MSNAMYEYKRGEGWKLAQDTIYLTMDCGTKVRVTKSKTKPGDHFTWMQDYEVIENKDYWERVRKRLTNEIYHNLGIRRLQKDLHNRVYFVVEIV